MNALSYRPVRASRSEFVTVRGLRHHLMHWGDASMASAERPPLLMLHGWMDVGASFQFVVDALAHDRHVIAPDWRGFGLTDTPHTDTYWHPDYLGDLDGLLDALQTSHPAAARVDLLGHSMGANVAMLYAGLRPERLRRLVNLEGFGLPATQPSQAPDRFLTWLDELKQPAQLRGYDSVQAVAARLQKTNPLLRTDRAEWLAAHWSRRDASGVWQILGDPVHKRSHPALYQKDEAMACWQRIQAPVLWVEGDRSEIGKLWGTRYSKEEFHQRVSVVRHVEKHVLSPAGHMLHHDQPEALALLLEKFLA
ncbi:MAG TPA: alpha/beta hydrolase [Rhizobacter sp.]|nr:alpha/beta hydrolase [Rhizobacter sp.]